MKALVKLEKGVGRMAIREMPQPVPQPDDVLVRLAAVGICGTDLKIRQDHFVYQPPVILGHESAGTIVALGENVRNWQIGDRVVNEQHTRACGICRYCLTGQRQFCPEKRSPGYMIDGAFAEYMRVPASLLHRIPDGMSFCEAALTEPMAVAAYAILGRCGIEPEDYAVILGCGPIALLAVQMLRAEGAARIMVTGTDADEKCRFAAARDFGAWRTVNVMQDDPVAAVMADTKGLGADVVIDLSGAAPAISQGLAMLRKDGRFCAIGMPADDIRIPWATCVSKAIRIIFSYSSDYASWERCLSMIRLGKIKLDRFTQDVFPLDQWEKAFDRAASGDALKVLFRIDEGDI